MEAIAQARSKREAQFAQAREEIDGIGLDEKLRKEILSLSLRELRGSLQQGKFTAVQVLCAYVRNALEVQIRTNCITALFTEAFDEARQLDERYSPDGDGSEKPPLFGLPFSVKGNFFVAGYDCPSGFIQFLDEPQSTTNSLVAHLRQLGGVPFAHTNVPQGLLFYLCTNPIYGTTTHPARADRTPGGTSGGEAALVAGGGAPFGIGADSGGSTRVPAAFCGLVTLKSCAERFRLANAVSGMPGTWGVARGYSFITPQVEDQRLLLEHIYGSEAYGRLAPPLLPLPFNHKLATRREKIRIGYFLDDGFLPATPGCRRAVVETVAKLRSLGHELVPFPLPEPETAALLVFKAAIPDGGAYYRARFAKEALIDPYVQSFVDYVHGVKFPAKEEASPQARIFNAASRIRDAADVTELQGQIDAYTARFHSAWLGAGLEALICPVFSLPAVGHSYPHRLPYCRFAPAIWNVLNLPAGVVPAGEWSEGDEAALHNECDWPAGENDVLKLMREAATGSVGLPLSVQVVALPYKEEVALRVMAEVEGLWTGTEAP